MQNLFQGTLSRLAPIANQQINVDVSPAGNGYDFGIYAGSAAPDSNYNGGILRIGAGLTTGNGYSYIQIMAPARSLGSGSDYNPMVSAAWIGPGGTFAIGSAPTNMRFYVDGGHGFKTESIQGVAYIHRSSSQYNFNTGTQAGSVFLPSALDYVGQHILIVDAAKNCSVNNIVLNSLVSEPIGGVVGDYTMSIDGMALLLTGSYGLPGRASGDPLGSPHWVIAGGYIPPGAVLPSTVTKFMASATIDNGGGTLATGVVGVAHMEYNATIEGVIVYTDLTETGLEIDAWKDTKANYPATIADTICASATMVFAGAKIYEDRTLTGWNKTVTAGDHIIFNVKTAAATATKAWVYLLLRKV